MIEILLALILFVLVLDMVLNSAWYKRGKANVPYVVKQKTVAIKKAKRG